jgi:hypothetical protein
MAYSVLFSAAYLQLLVVSVITFSVSRYQIFCVAVGVELGTLSLVRINRSYFKEK